MTDRRANTIVNMFNKFCKKVNMPEELSPHIYKDGDRSRTHLINGFMLISMSGELVTGLSETNENLFTKYIRDPSVYDTVIDVPSESTLKAYMKENNIKADFSNHKDWKNSFRIDDITVNVKFLYIILEMLDEYPQARVVKSSGSLSPIYFEDDNGNYALLLPIRRKTTTLPYNDLVTRFQPVELGTLWGNEEFRDSDGKWGKKIANKQDDDPNECRCERTRVGTVNAWNDKKKTYNYEEVNEIYEECYPINTTVYVRKAQ